MRHLFIGSAAVIAVLVAVALHQVGRGPRLMDRLLGVVLAAANTLVLVLLIGAAFDRLDMFVDLALAYALLGFLFPLALAKYLQPAREGRSDG